MKKSLAGLFIALGAINVIQCTALAEASEKVSKELISEINSDHGNFEKKYDKLRQKEGPLWKEQKYEELIILWHEIEDLMSQKYEADSPEMSFTFYNLGRIYGLANKRDKSITYANKAIALYNEKITNAEKDISVGQLAIWHYMIGRMGEYTKDEYLAKSQYDRAIDLFKEKQAITVLSRSDAKRLIKISGYYWSLRDHLSAENVWKLQLDYRLAKYGNEDGRTAYAYFQLGRLNLAQDQYIKAENNFKNSIQSYEGSKSIGENHTVLINVLTFYSDMAMKTLNYEEAEAALLRAHKISKDSFGPNHQRYAYTLQWLALFYSDQGQYNKSLNHIDQAMSINKDIYGTNHQNIAYNMHNKSLIMAKMGRHDEAYDLAVKAFNLFNEVEVDNEESIDSSLRNLSLLKSQRGQIEESINLAKELLERIKVRWSGRNHSQVAFTMGYLGHLYSSAKQYTKAISITKEAIDIYKSLGLEDDINAISYLNNLGVYYSITRKFDLAEQAYFEVLEHRSRTGMNTKRSSGLINGNLAVLYAKQGMNSKSAEYLRKSLGRNLELFQLEGPYMPRKYRAAFIRSFKDDSARLVFSSAFKSEVGALIALEYRLNRQGLLAEIEKRQMQLINNSQSLSPLIARVRNIVDRLSDLTLDQKEREVLIQEQEKIEGKIYGKLPQLKPRIITVDQISKTLSTNSVLIEYQKFYPYNSDERKYQDPRYMAILLSSSNKIDVLDLGDAKIIDTLISQSVSAINGLYEANNKLDELSAYLIDPVAEIIPESANIWYLSPDSEINRVPFAALRSPQTGQYYSDSKKIRLLTTGRELLAQAASNKKIEGNKLILADPSFQLTSSIDEIDGNLKSQTKDETSLLRSAEINAGIQWNRLPGTLKEGKEISEIINADLFLGDSATPNAVKNSTNNLVIHIASHAFYLPNQPVQFSDSEPESYSERGFNPLQLSTEHPLLRSGIALAGANNPSLRSNDDGYLTALEIAQLNWESTELVVVSACQSGRGDIEDGDGVYGLKRSIAVSGAKSSLLSLWNVDDAATAAFMTMFYTKLKQGLTKEDSLLETQAEFKSHEKVLWRQPFVWAAFQLTGDWSSIKNF